MQRGQSVPETQLSSERAHGTGLIQSPDAGFISSAVPSHTSGGQYILKQDMQAQGDANPPPPSMKSALLSFSAAALPLVPLSLSFVHHEHTTRPIPIVMGDIGNIGSPKQCKILRTVSSESGSVRLLCSVNFYSMSTSLRERF